MHLDPIDLKRGAKCVENNVKIIQKEAKKSKAGAKTVKHSWKKTQLWLFGGK